MLPDSSRFGRLPWHRRFTCCGWFVKELEVRNALNWMGKEPRSDFTSLSGKLILPISLLADHSWHSMLPMPIIYRGVVSSLFRLLKWLLMLGLCCSLISKALLSYRYYVPILYLHRTAIHSCEPKICSYCHTTVSQSFVSSPGCARCPKLRQCHRGASRSSERKR